MSRCVPIQSNVNTTEAFFAALGGSSGGGGNVNASTITFVSSLTFVDSDVPPSGSLVRPPMYLYVDNNTTVLQVNNTDPGQGSAIWLIGGNAAAGRGIIRCKNPQGGGGLNDMNIEAFTLTIATTNSVSINTNLNVSSINGAAAVSASAVSTLEGKVALLMSTSGL